MLANINEVIEINLSSNADYQIEIALSESDSVDGQEKCYCSD